MMLPQVPNMKIKTPLKHKAGEMRTKQEILDKLKRDEEYLKNVKFKPADIPIYITILKEISVLKWVLGEE